MGDIEDVQRRERRFQRRTGRRVAVGGIVGAVIGALLGLVAGIVAFDAGTTPMWTMAIAGAIFGGGVAAVIVGMSGLESPPPGREPLHVDRPLRDVDDPTVEHDVERDERRRDAAG